MFVRLDLSQRLRPINRPEAVVSNVCGRCEPLHEDSTGMNAARECATSVSSRPVGSDRGFANETAGVQASAEPTVLHDLLELHPAIERLLRACRH
jgi:hypothetical protein